MTNASQDRHPFSDYEVRVYAGTDGAEPKFIAYIGPCGKVPVHYSADTHDEAFERAETARLEYVEKYESAVIAKRKAARERKQSKQCPAFPACQKMENSTYTNTKTQLLPRQGRPQTILSPLCLGPIIQLNPNHKGVGNE